MSQIDNLASENSISRQKLIERVLETAIKDPNFEIEISTEEEV